MNSDRMKAKRERRTLPKWIKEGDIETIIYILKKMTRGMELEDKLTFHIHLVKRINTETAKLRYQQIQEMNKGNVKRSKNIKKKR